MRLDIGEFFLKACLQCELRETSPTSQSNKIDTLSIHGLGDGFSLQVVAGDSVMVPGQVGGLGGGVGGTPDFK